MTKTNIHSWTHISLKNVPSCDTVLKGSVTVISLYKGIFFLFFIKNNASIIAIYIMWFNDSIMDGFYLGFFIFNYFGQFHVAGAFSISVIDCCFNALDGTSSVVSS